MCLHDKHGWRPCPALMCRNKSAHSNTGSFAYIHRTWSGTLSLMYMQEHTKQKTTALLLLLAITLQCSLQREIVTLNQNVKRPRLWTGHLCTGPTNGHGQQTVNSGTAIRSPTESSSVSSAGRSHDTLMT